jgi:hypothetical protein
VDAINVSALKRMLPYLLAVATPQWLPLGQ